MLYAKKIFSYKLYAEKLKSQKREELESLSFL